MKTFKKHLYKLLVAGTMITAISGCTKVDEKPYDLIISENFLQTGRMSSGISCDLSNTASGRFRETDYSMRRSFRRMNS